MQFDFKNIYLLLNMCVTDVLSNNRICYPQSNYLLKYEYDDINFMFTKGSRKKKWPGH